MGRVVVLVLKREVEGLVVEVLKRDVDCGCCCCWGCCVVLLLPLEVVSHDTRRGDLGERTTRRKQAWVVLCSDLQSARRDYLRLLRCFAVVLVVQTERWSAEVGLVLLVVRRTSCFRSAGLLRCCCYSVLRQTVTIQTVAVEVVHYSSRQRVLHSELVVLMSSLHQIAASTDYSRCCRTGLSLGLYYSTRPARPK